MSKISIIIATYNRCKSLHKTLESLSKQEDINVTDYEIIVVDNNSVDNTKDIINSFKQNFNGRLKYLQETRQGKSFALNVGIKEASGDIVAFLDDDAVADKKWVKNILEFFNEFRSDAMGGRILPTYPTGTPQWVKDNKDLLVGPIVLHDYGEDIKLYKKPMVPFVGANIAIKKKLFYECGFFRTDLGPGQGTFGDDTYLFQRLKNTNKKIYYCGKALVWHPAEKNRMNLFYIANWMMASGGYNVRIKGSKSTRETFVYYFGIPRYLIREVIESALSLILRVFNRREFLKAWIETSYKLGMVFEFRKSYQSRKTVNSLKDEIA